MVKDYLEKLFQEYEQEKRKLDEQVSKKNILLKENIEFIKLLEESSDNSYELFTPREVNSKNKNKILELKEEQKKIAKELDDLKKEQGEWVQKIDELQSVIRVQKLSDDLSRKVTEEVEEDKAVRIALLETQENERQRISRELHDSTVQNLTSLVHKTELCNKLVDMDPIRCKLELSAVNHILRDIIQNTRDLIYDLRPMSFDDIGLDITVRDAIQKIEKANSIHIQYVVEGKEIIVPSVVGISILRIIQEGCSNAIKHGNAKLISIKLSYQKNAIEVSIEDDGCGFDIEDIPDTIREDHSGFGISMMKERIYLLSGELDIKSKIGEGTKIFASIPVNEREEI